MINEVSQSDCGCVVELQLYAADIEETVCQPLPASFCVMRAAHGRRARLMKGDFCAVLGQARLDGCGRARDQARQIADR